MIEKMEFLRITGPKEDIDRVNEKYLMKYDMHMENAMTELSDVINIKPYVEVNPHKEILAKAENLMKMLEITEPAKEKEITTFNVQVAEFIRNHKKDGTAIDIEVTEKLVIPFSLDADQIDDLLERLTDGGISITDKEGNPSSKYVVEEPKPEELTKSCLVAILLRSMTLSVCTLKKLVLFLCLLARKKKNWRLPLLKVTFKPNSVWQKQTCVWWFLLPNVTLVVGCSSLI